MFFFALAGFFLSQWLLKVPCVIKLLMNHLKYLISASLLSLKYLGITAFIHLWFFSVVAVHLRIEREVPSAA